ncbi:MAG TPA: sigma 54-interacting transcriptional regulator [Thermoanaerobaculia bacterium]
MTTEPLPLAVPLPPRFQLRTVLKESPGTLVYRVFDASDNRDEAIKVLRHELSEPQQRLRFEAEFATLAELDHPNIVKVYDYGLVDDRYPYFTMEYVHGRRISEFFDGKNWNALYDVVLHIASALHYIHRRGIVHLDLKPSNILIDESGCAKLMDFGLAIATRQVLDRQIRGTLQYMAPEVLKQDRVDSRADLYALGMTLYETVTGALPGYGKAPIDVIRMHLDEEIRPPSSINPQVPAALEEIILKLLEKDPRHRYASAAALLYAVAEASGHTVPTGELLLGQGELYAAPLIGRATEVNQLMSLIAQARDGSGGGVIIAGAEGVGKSRIVRDVILRAQIDGARVFSGRCPVNRKTIYAPFLDIFRQLVTAVNPDAAAGEEIRQILRPGGGGNPHEGDKYRLYNHIVQSMQDIYGFLSAGSDTSGTPLIILIEDLQWADPSTADLFAFLVSEAKLNQLLVIGTLTLQENNNGNADSNTFWEQRAKETGFPIIRIESLTETLVHEHVESLLGESLGDEFVRWMFWESSGSPLNIRRIFDYLITHGYLEWKPAGWTVDMERIRALRIPGGAAAILMEKADTLHDDGCALLEAAAVLGEVSSVGLLTQVSDFSPERTYELLRELVTNGLLDESTSGSVITFPQMHLRDSIYNGMTDQRRSDLHLRVGNALEPMLEAGSQLVGQIAYHFARANETDKGIRYAVEAGDIATRSLAHAEATEFYRTAIELLDLSNADESQKADVREKLADAYYRNNDSREAMQTFQFLLKSFQVRNNGSGPSIDVARVMKKIGKVLNNRGEHDSAMSYFQNALDTYEQLEKKYDVAEMMNRIAGIYREKDNMELASEMAEKARAMLDDEPPTVVAGYIRNTQGIIEYALGNWQRAKQIFLDAYCIGDLVGSGQLKKKALTNLGNTLWKLGDWETALEYYHKNMQLSETEGDLWNLVTCYNNVGIIEFGRGRFHSAAEFFEKSIRIDQKIGALEYEALALENLGEALEMVGKLDDAAKCYARCLALEGFDEARSSRSSVYVPLARFTKKRGDIAKALEYAQKALAAAERTRDEDLIAEACYARAAIEDERDNIEESEVFLKRAIAIFEHNNTKPGLARAYTAAAGLALRQNNLEAALDFAERSAKVAKSLNDRFTLAKNDWVWGKILFFQGQREAAVQRLESARVAFEECDTPYELARLLFEIGVMREEPEEASQTIRNAIRIFERLNATHDLERARGALLRIKPAGKAPDQNVVGLYEVVKIINSSLNLNDVLNRVLDLGIRRLRAERGMILLLDPITSALRTRVVRNINEADGGSKRSPQSIVKEVIQTGQVIMSADARADERFVESESVIAENILSILCVPLISKERIAGAINVDHRQARHLFSQKDVSFLEAFADQAAIAIENARLYEELEEARTRLSLENESLRREVLVEKHLDSIVGHSEAVAKIQFAVRKASASNSTILLRGESGTGKGLIARIIHNMGPRRNGPFINFNCAALPETLAESELFGHEKGSFTGADRRKLGRFELANNGTIFLDEIGKMSLAMQSKLLRVVEEKEFERVGGTQTIKTDVKIIAATNLEMEKAIDDGSFREDLFYRLNIIPLQLPPLRDRKDDIPLLVEHFIRKISKDLGIEPKRLEPGILDLFMRYHWPGNIRELEATLHRSIVMSNGDTITRNEFYGLFAGTAHTIVAEVPPPSPQSLLNPSLARIEITSDVYDEVLASVDKQLIERALDTCGGRIREAARRLGLARNTLKSKMQKYNIAGRE